MDYRIYRVERELETVPPNTVEENHPSPTSSPPTPPSPLPVSVGPGYQHYLFPSSPPYSPPFSPRSSSPDKPQHYQTIESPAKSIPSNKKPAKPVPPNYNEYSPLLPQHSVPSDEDDDNIEWPSTRRRPRSFLRRLLEKIFCCCRIPDCCPPLFLD